MGLHGSWLDAVTLDLQVTGGFVAELMAHLKAEKRLHAKYAFMIILKVRTDWYAPIWSRLCKFVHALFQR